MGITFIFALGGWMAAVSWRKWPGLIADYGQQVYLPWQISLGQVLYKDVDHLHGPLSLYLHALLFKWFGPGFMVLAWFNLGMVVVLTLTLYCMFRALSDTLTATVVSLAFLGIFAFGQYGGMDNFNFIAPYSYEATHGLILSFLALLCFFQYLEKPSSIKLMASGFLTGLVLLTKLEVFLALIVALGVGLTLDTPVRTGGGRNLAGKVLDFGFPFCVPYLAYAVYFTMQGAHYNGIFSILSQWVHFPDASWSDIPLYQWAFGWDQPLLNLHKILMGFLLFTGLFTGLIVLARWVADLKFDPPILFTGSFSVLIAAVISVHGEKIQWLELLRPLPLLILIFAGYLVISLFRKRSETLASQKTKALLIYSVFSLILLAKVFLNTHVYHYGFFLALPGTLLLIHILLHALPRLLLESRAQIQIYAAPALVLILIFIGNHAASSYRQYALKDFPVGKQRDLVYDYRPEMTQRGRVIAQALDYLDKDIPADKSVAPLPQGALVSYMARRPIPLRTIHYNSVESHFVPQREYLDKLQESPPDYLLLMDKDLAHLETDAFGRDYGSEIFSWIQTHYSSQAVLGDPPFQGKDFGIQILKRNTRSDFS